jgi:1,4-alpha-glucan branching enzyme
MIKRAIKTAPSKSQQTFSFNAPGALSVQLVADFTHWEKSPLNLRKESDGMWRTAVDLEPGTYHYRFLVDGQWRDDPECTLRVPNPYGGTNTVRKVS